MVPQGNLYYGIGLRFGLPFVAFIVGVLLFAYGNAQDVAWARLAGAIAAVVGLVWLALSLLRRRSRSRRHGYRSDRARDTDEDESEGR